VKTYIEEADRGCEKTREELEEENDNEKYRFLKEGEHMVFGVDSMYCELPSGTFGWCFVGRDYNDFPIYGSTICRRNIKNIKKRKKRNLAHNAKIIMKGKKQKS